MADTTTTLSKALAQTVEAHLQALQPKTPGSNDVNTSAILANLAENYTHDFGHSYFVSTAPHLQSRKTGDQFVTHMSGMATMLQTWSIHITDTCVDAEKRSAVVRADFHMTPKGGETVVNDIVFWMGMDERGEKVVRLTEFVDPVASRELGVRMKAGMEKVGGGAP